MKIKNISYLPTLIGFLLFSSLINCNAWAQSIYTSSETNPYNPVPLSSLDSLKFSGVLPVEIPDCYKYQNIILPSSVDNSTRIYFRPVTSQSGYECGQTASQAFVFTYEVDRLRNLNASLPQNQYPTHFPWNFSNNAYNYGGASFFDSWEITRMCGTPNVTEYGGALNTGGEKRWMTGYANYYSGMKNRLSGVYAIRCNSPEDVYTLKAWLYDHLDGSSIGGLAAIYGQYCSPNTTLPSGTPMAGKALISTWGTSPSHAWTIVGYNDSIRYDFNGDGQYTNNIDLNGDGKLDVRDWEIGGLKIVNGYAGTGWGNGGFSYMMYKAMADGISNGGIWNSTAYIIKAKTTQNPQYTYKVTLKHSVRNQIKVIAGVSQNTSSTAPEFRMEFPIFNFQGSTLGMQGDTTESAKTIEFGLDVTPLLSYLPSGISARFFFEVVEKDPNGSGAGQITSFSLMDYTSGVSETVYPNSNIILINNDTTRISVIKNIAFSKPIITTDTLKARIYSNFTQQIQAQNGQAPYRWRLKPDYQESVSSATFPSTPATVLPTGNDGSVMQNLNFDFPFLGKKYNQIYVYANGFIKFDNSLFSFPWQVDAELLFKSHALIAPFYVDLTYGSGQNVTFQQDVNSATIIWKGSVNGQSGSNVQVALKMFSSGMIEFYYGTISMSGNWKSAISGGNVVNCIYTSLSNTFTTNTSSRKITLTPPDYPNEINLTEGGIFTAKPVSKCSSNFKVIATDNNNIESEKVLHFETFGIQSDFSINAGGDTSLNIGDTVNVSVKLSNIGTSYFSNGLMKIQIADTNTSLIDSVISISSIAPGDSLVIHNAFKFVVKLFATDGHMVRLDGIVTNPTDTFKHSISCRINSFLLQTGTTTITDGNNNQLEPGETAALMLEIKNIGGASARNLQLNLTTSDPYITLNPSSSTIDSIQPFSSKNAFFIITVAPNTPYQHLIVLNASITGNNNSQIKTFFYIQMGIEMEDFETNDFTKFDWVLGGTIPWYTSDSLKYQGNYSAKSGRINHSQSSYFSINQLVLADGSIKFHRKVSCEKDNTNHNYDYLAFTIDGIEQARWDGETDWEQVSFPVTKGNHTFKWSYIKDYSVNTGADCAWVDNIIFPLHGDLNPQLTSNISSISKTININSIDSATVVLSNNGNDLILCTNQLINNNNMNVPWANTSSLACGIYPGTQQTLKLYFDSHQLNQGVYLCNLNLNQNLINTISIPVTLTVMDFSSVMNEPGMKTSSYPNPFSEFTIIRFFLEETEKPTVQIYDLNGRLLTDLSDKIKRENNQWRVIWNGCDYFGNKLSNGIYFCKIKSKQKQTVEKLMLNY